MPRFAFKCEGCGEEFELFLKVDEVASGCPLCESMDIHKVFTKFATKTRTLDEKRVEDLYKDTIEYNRNALKEQKVQFEREDWVSGDKHD